MRAVVRRLSVSERADVGCCGMTVAQGATLAALLAGGPMRLGDLGRRLGIRASTLTRNLGRLEERGLVRREVDGEDGRAFRAALTERGRRLATTLGAQDEVLARRILDRLPPPRRAAVVEALEALLMAVRDATESCCPGAFDHLMTGLPRELSRGTRRTR